jgi:H+-transporting ATPase
MFRHQNLLETLQFALVLLIAAVPVALPAVLSITMAVGGLQQEPETTFGPSSQQLHY